MYMHKKKNKFPHIVCINIAGDDPTLKECNSWVTHNIGAYKKSWFCPSYTTVPDNYDKELWPYAFKSLEDAMAFKLMWL